MPGDPDVSFLSRLARNLRNRGPDPLRPCIDEYLLARSNSKARLNRYTIDMAPRLRPHGRFTPSGLGGCQRKAALTFVGTPGRKALDLDLELIFEDGNWRHHKWQALFLDMEIVLGKDRFEVVSIEDRGRDASLFLMGYSDAVVKISGVEYIIDFKGINDRGFNWVTQDDEPKGPHVIQVTGYEHLFGVKKGILLYENKDKNRTRSMAVPYSEDNWRDTVMWIESVVEKMEARRLPPRHPECNKGSFLYESKCPFAYICFPPDAADFDRVAVARRVYEDFRGVKKAWVSGNKEIRR